MVSKVRALESAGVSGLKLKLLLLSLGAKIIFRV